MVERQLGIDLAKQLLQNNVVYLASPRNPVVIAGVALLMLAVGVGSCWSPLRRFLWIVPFQAVRSEAAAPQLTRFGWCV